MLAFFFLRRVNVAHNSSTVVVNSFLETLIQTIPCLNVQQNWFGSLLSCECWSTLFKSIYFSQQIHDVQNQSETIYLNIFCGILCQRLRKHVKNFFLRKSKCTCRSLSNQQASKKKKLSILLGVLQIYYCNSWNITLSYSSLLRVYFE